MRANSLTGSKCAKWEILVSAAASSGRAGTFDGLREGREGGEGSSFQLRKFDNQVLTHPCLGGWICVRHLYTRYPDSAEWKIVWDTRGKLKYLSENSVKESKYAGNTSAERSGIHVSGLPYMTSAVGGWGVPKKQTKGTKSADLCTW